jgi:hypothetical protein
MRFGGEMTDPFFQFRFVVRGPRIRHFFYHVNFHLPRVIKRTSDLHRLGLLGADPLAEVEQIRPPDRQRRAGQHRGGLIAKKQLAQFPRQVDRGDMCRGELIAAPRDRRPINTVLGLLVGKDGQAVEKSLQAQGRFPRLGAHFFRGIRRGVFDHLPQFL